MIGVALAGWTPTAHAGDVELRGTIATALHVGVDACAPTIGDCRFLDFQDLVVVGVEADGEVGDAVEWRIDTRLRLHPFPAADEVGDTRAGNVVQPFTVDVPEAYVELEEVLGSAVDVRVGQQRFRWGTGLGVHPTDVANPYDLRDPTQFDNRLGSAALAVRIHEGQTEGQLVWVPLFRPARMPAEVDLIANAADLFDFEDMGAGDVEIGEFETRTAFPDERIGFMQFGGRLTTATSAVDLSAMVWRGYDSLPQAGGEARIVGFQTAEDRVDIGIPIDYPSFFAAGGDLRAGLPGDVGVWVEGVVMFPERVVVTASRAQLDSLVRLGTIDEVPDPLPEAVIQDGRPYPRFVAGVDRTFGRVMVAGQWVHGLPTERTAQDVRDYGLLVTAISVSEVTRVGLRGMSDLQGVLLGADVSVLHRDAATISLGATIARGAPGTALGDLRALSNVSVAVDAAF